MNGERTDDDLGGLMRAARAYARIGQSDLAERIGVSTGTVSAWERGKTRVPQIARPGVVRGLMQVTGWPESFFTEGRGQ